MRPLVGISSCSGIDDGLGYDRVFRKYTEAANGVADVTPVLVPALGDASDTESLLAGLDGLLLTGSPSNVEPWRYRGRTSRVGVHHDPARDATTLSLIQGAVHQGVPLLALCRGFQELNVAFGGTLHQHLQEVAGRIDHREDEERPPADRYDPVHQVALTPGGYLAALLGIDSLTVNSLHEQGVAEVGPGLLVEATAADGTIEALRVAGAQRLALGVQWHPEGRSVTTPGAAALFAAFGTACRERQEERTGQQH